MINSKPGEEFWQSDEYLKQNAAGAHSNSHAILAELEIINEQLRELNLRLVKNDRNIVALGVGIVIVVLLFVFK